MSTVSPSEEAAFAALLSELDEALGEVVAAATARGRQPSCRAGCAFCCHHAIRVSRTEARAIVRYVAEHFEPAARSALDDRLAAWLEWLRGVLADDAGGGASAWPPGALEERILARAPVCPFLVDHRCSVYPVRPIVCRAHYVTTPKEQCLPIERGGAAEKPARLLHEGVEAGLAAAARLRTLEAEAARRGGPSAEEAAVALDEVLFLAEAYAREAQRAGSAAGAQAPAAGAQAPAAGAQAPGADGQDRAP